MAIPISAVFKPETFPAWPEVILGPEVLIFMENVMENFVSERIESRFWHLVNICV